MDSVSSSFVSVLLIGFLASFVDGALGMGFGPTSSSLLLASGVSPITTSAAVNVAKVVTGVAGAASHWRLGNIDRSLVIRLAIPGAVGAVVGATILDVVDADTLRPLLAAMLLAVGVRILVRFRKPLPVGSGSDGPADDRLRNRVIAVGGAGGITNGLVGAWGPVVTPFMLQSGVAPRIAVGSVNTAEVAVATVAAGTLLSSITRPGFEVGLVVAMVIGGVIAAPLGAYAVRYFPARLLGLGVAAILLVTQVRELDRTSHLPVPASTAYLVIAVALAGAVAWPTIRSSESRASRATAQCDDQASLSSTSD